MIFKINQNMVIAILVILGIVLLICKAQYTVAEKFDLMDLPKKSSLFEQRSGASKYYDRELQEDETDVCEVNERPRKSRTEVYDNRKSETDIYNFYVEKNRGPQCKKCDITQHKDFDKYVLKSSVPPCPDMSKYALKSMIPPQPDMSKYILKSEVPSCPKCPPIRRPKVIVKEVIKEVDRQPRLKKEIIKITDHPDFHKFISRREHEEKLRRIKMENSERKRSKIFSPGYCMTGLC